MASVKKSCEIKGSGQEMAVMVKVNGKNFYNTNSGEFCADQFLVKLG